MPWPRSMNLSACPASRSFTFPWTGHRFMLGSLRQGASNGLECSRPEDPAWRVAASCGGFLPVPSAHAARPPGRALAACDGARVRVRRRVRELLRLGLFAFAALPISRWLGTFGQVAGRDDAAAEEALSAARQRVGGALRAVDAALHGEIAHESSTHPSERNSANPAARAPGGNTSGVPQPWHGDSISTCCGSASICDSCKCIAAPQVQRIVRNGDPS